MVNILLPRSELFIPGGDLLSLGEFCSGIVSLTDLALIALLVLELALLEVLAVECIVQKELNVKQSSQQKEGVECVFGELSETAWYPIGQLCPPGRPIASDHFVCVIYRAIYYWFIAETTYPMEVERGGQSRPTKKTLC